MLSRTAGAEPVGRLVQERDKPDVRTYHRQGQGRRAGRALPQRTDANLVVFDDTLAPAQARNLEKMLQRNVIDRTEVILDIFARHARSREAKLQVELAQLQYMRPRLKSLWDHLSRQNGGIGTRGPGETQLEVDRRRVDEKISHLKAQLAERRTSAKTQRQSRAGDLRRRAGRLHECRQVVAHERARRHRVAGGEQAVLDAGRDHAARDAGVTGHPALVADTVGFIRKLPHDLVASFRTTLEEINEADLILHVVDVTSSSRGGAHRHGERSAGRDPRRPA